MRVHTMFNTFIFRVVYTHVTAPSTSEEKVLREAVADSLYIRENSQFACMLINTSALFFKETEK